LQIEHGSSVATGSLYNDTVAYECTEGFQLDGSEQIVCLANQVIFSKFFLVKQLWSPSFPKDR